MPEGEGGERDDDEDEEKEEVKDEEEGGGGGGEVDKRLATNICLLFKYGMVSHCAHNYVF